MMKAFGGIGLVLTLMFVPALTAAQTAQVGGVSGEVTDATGARLPGATVTLVSVERGVARSTVTDGEGAYRFSLVALGTYNVSVELSGFTTVQITNNLVEAEKTTHVMVSLQVASLTEATTVVGRLRSSMRAIRRSRPGSVSKSSKRCPGHAAT